MGEERNPAIIDFAAARKWSDTPDRVKEILLGNAWCPNCYEASFAPGFSLRDDPMGFVVEGRCSKCGAPIARCSW